MTGQNSEFKVECDDKSCTISGVMRLSSPVAYLEHFEIIRHKMRDASDKFIVDISKVEYLNSSGINAFGRIIIYARQEEIPLIILGDSQYPWQQKSIKPLEKLWDKLEVRIQ
jgi:hypothetical protein